MVRSISMGCFLLLLAASFAGGRCNTNRFIYTFAAQFDVRTWHGFKVQEVSVRLSIFLPVWPLVDTTKKKIKKQKADKPTQLSKPTTRHSAVVRTNYEIDAQKQTFRPLR